MAITLPEYPTCSDIAQDMTAVPDVGEGVADLVQAYCENYYAINGSYPSAISTAMFMTTITLFISGVTHIILGHFVFWLWLIIFIGSVSGSFIGTALKKRFTSRILKFIMIFTLITIAGILLIQTWIVL